MLNASKHNVQTAALKQVQCTMHH